MPRQERDRATKDLIKEINGRHEEGEYTESELTDEEFELMKIFAEKISDTLTGLIGDIELYQKQKSLGNDLSSVTKRIESTQRRLEQQINRARNNVDRLIDPKLSIQIHFLHEPISECLPVYERMLEISRKYKDGPSKVFIQLNKEYSRIRKIVEDINSTSVIRRVMDRHMREISDHTQYRVIHKSQIF